MSEYFYLNHQNSPQGPYTLDQLAEMMTSGRVNPTTLVACKGASSWEPLGSVLSRENIPTPDIHIEPGKVGNCPSCGHDLSGDIKEGQLPANCPQCLRALWVGKPGLPMWANFRLSIRNYFNFNGRATRAEYWFFQLVNAIVMLGLYAILVAGIIAALIPYAVEASNAEEATADFLNSTFTGGSVVSLVIILLSSLALLVWSLFILIPSLSVTVRRMHDVGWSGKWLILYIIISLLPLCFMIPYGISNFATTGAESAVDMPESISLLIVLTQLAGYGFGLFLFVLMVLDSKRGPNQYGPSSKYPLG